MKRSIEQKCRYCHCTDSESCRIVTPRGQRDCEWHEPGLCDNPRCLKGEAMNCLSIIPEVDRAFTLNERAELIAAGRQ